MPLPRLGGLASGLGGLATVLGLGFEGYAKDQATRVERERNRLKDIADAKMLEVQMAEHQANTASREATTKLAQNKAIAQQGAFKQLQQRFPTHPSVGAGYVEGGEYTDILDRAMAQETTDKKTDLENRSRFASLVANFPGDPTVQAFAKGGYTPEKAFALKDVWESADKRYGIEHAYHAPAATPGMWAFDNDSKTNVYVTRDALISAPPGRFTKPAAAGAGGGGGGAVGAIAPQSVQAMYDSAEDADRIMKRFEKKYKAGDTSISPISSGLGAAAGQTPKGFLEGVKVTGSNWLLGMSNSDYQTYLAAQRRFGNIMGNLQARRYTEHQATLDTDLSGLKGGGEADATIALKQGFRNELIGSRPPPPPGYTPRVRPPPGPGDDDYVEPGATAPTAPSRSLTPAPPARGLTPAPAPKPISQTAPGPTTGAYSGMGDGAVWDQAVRENGMAAVLKEFGTRAQYIARNKKR